MDRGDAETETNFQSHPSTKESDARHSRVYVSPCCLCGNEILKADSPGLKHATLIKDSSSTAAKASILDNIDTRELNMEDGEMALYARSYYGDPGQWACSNALSLPPPHGILGSNAPGRGPFVNRIEFEMYVQSPDKESIHSYTSNQTEIGAPSRALEDVSNWRSSYPLLEEYYENGQLDSEIILIESNLNVLGEYPPIGSTLSIDFRVNIAGLAGQKQWSLKSEYYENQGQLVDMRTFYARHNIRKSFPWDTPNIFQGAAGSDVALEIPLHSPWWVQLFTKMATRKRETKHDPYLSQQEDEWSRRYLEDMSIMQELWVDRGIDGSPGSRVAIILWQFSQAHGAAGTTTWRKLKSPPARIQINSPSQLHPPPLAHSVVLDSALQSLAMPQAISVNTERFLHNVDLFTDGIERIDTQSQSARGSESPALSPDYTTSFPSSTSTSFPPSITHGYLSHEDSQESACFSQESDVSRKGSLDAQYPFAYSQKSAYSYQEPRTYGDDLRYLSDNHAFDTQDPAYYSQQSFDSIPHYHAEAHYDSLDGEPPHDSSFAGPDFTGGKIQLSFQQHDVLANTQVVPALGMAHVGHAPEAQDHAVVQALHPTIQGFLAVVADTAAVGHVHHEDFDFSTLESHFTPEEIAALRMQDPEHHQPGGLGALLHDRSVVPNFNHLHASFHGSGEHLIMDTLNHVDDDALVRMEHGVVLREVSGKEIEGAVREVNEEELASDEVNGEESQVVEGQGQRIDGGPEDGYDDDDDGLHEDAL